MAKNISIVDVAKLAGVSISTVSRVLNGNSKVKKELVKKVLDAVNELNFIPNINARNIRSKKSNTIACVLPDISDNFYSKVLEGILCESRENGLNVLVFSYHGDTSKEIECLNAAAMAGVGGLLYCPSSYINAKQLQYSFPIKFPIVIVYRRHLIDNIPHIYHDNIQGGYQATKYLLMQGHREIAFFISFWQKPSDSIDDILALIDNPNRGAYTSIDRLVGYIKALEEAGITLDKSLLQLSQYSYESGYNSTKGFLTKLRSFDAIISCNDSVATGILQALREQNIIVPDQVSIVGYDDSILATISRPMLTTIRQEPVRMGHESVEMVIELIEGKVVEDRMIDVQLRIGNSTSVKTKISN